jgi:PhnB protein
MPLCGRGRAAASGLSREGVCEAAGRQYDGGDDLNPESGRPAMARVSTYLNFPRNTEEAFDFYRTVFGTKFEGDVNRFSDVPPQEGQPAVAEEDGNLVMHVALPILGGHLLRGTDAPESMGFKVMPGNNVYINLEPDTRAETDRLFNALSEGGKVEMPLQEMFWGAYFGSCTDKFGVQWMFNCANRT